MLIIIIIRQQLHAKPSMQSVIKFDIYSDRTALIIIYGLKDDV